MIENIEQLQIVQILEGKKFIGSFPGNIDVLLVPLQTAIEELSMDFKDITPNVLRNILKKHNVQIFNNVEDWAKFKGLDLKRKKRR